MERLSKIDRPWKGALSDGDTVRFGAAIAIVLAMSIAAGGSCKRQHRRGDSLDDEGGGRPSDRVAVESDPRFPRRPDVSPARRGLWVEQPRETGPVSPTELANAVAGRLDDLQRRCCGETGARCRGFDGRILLEFTLGQNGRVRDVEIEETTIYDDAFQSCALDRAATWRLVGHSGPGEADVFVPLRVRVASDAANDERGR